MYEYFNERRHILYNTVLLFGAGLFYKYVLFKYCTYNSKHSDGARRGPPVSARVSTFGGHHERLGRRRYFRAADVRVRPADRRLLARRIRVEQLDGNF